MKKLSRTIGTILNLKDLFSPTLRETVNNTKEFQRQIQHTQNDITKFRDSVSNSFGNVKAKVAGAVAGLGIAEFAKKSVTLASDLVEVQNVVDTTFGSGAAQINAWSKTALNAFGLNQLQAKQFTGYLGAMMKSSGITGSALTKMSENLVGLAGDMASFDNLDPELAFEKIRSGISGETEPLKEIGINMDVTNLKAYALSQGIKKSYDSMSQAEQVTLRYNYLMAVTADKHGDFAKTQQTFANQTRIAKANIEQAGASIATGFLPYLNKLLLMFNNGGLKSIGNIFSGIGNTIVSIANSTKTPVQSLANSLGSLGQASGLKSMFSGLDSKPLETLKYTINSVIYGVRDLANFISNHMTIAKTILVGFAGGFAATKMVQEFLKITSAIAKVKEGIEGLKRLSSAGKLLESVFKLPVPALAIIAGIAVIAAGAYLIISHWTQLKNFFKGLWTWMKQEVVIFWNWLKGFMSGWGGILLVVLNPVLGIPLLIITHWTQIKTFFNGLLTWLKMKWTNTMIWFASLPSKWYSYGANMFTSFKNGAGAIVNTIGTWIKAKFTAFINFFKNLPSQAYQWGKDIVGQLKAGIQAKVNDVVQTAKDLGKKILDGIKNVFGIHSPSKVMFAIGGYLIQGLTNAILKSKGSLTSVISKVFGGAMDFAKGIFSGGDVASWLSTALALTGTDQSWLSGLLKLTSYESGDPGKLGTGSASMVNGQSVGGEYATGLLQMLPSTFREFSAGLGSITNPIANAAAAIKYIKSRYGSVYNTPLFTSGGKYNGYANGGIATRASIFGEAGAEMAIPLKRNNPRSNQLLNQASTIINGNNKGQSGDIYVNVTIEGNVIGNEEYATYVGNTVATKIVNKLQLA